ncbi:MAG: hypothetical protein WEA79_06160 [Balneolaceae bacterium]
MNFLKAAVFLLVLLSPSCLFAQADMEDVIYLKNGGILRGEIIEMTENISLQIETAGRNVIVVKMEDVEEIKKEEKPLPRYYKKSGYVNFTGLDYLTGDENSSVLRFQMVNGYQFTSGLSAGIGIGFITYNDPLNAISLFLDLRYKLLEANTTPFIYFKSGYNFALSPNENYPIEEYSGGYLLNPGIGIQFDNSEGFGWYFSAGYNVDNLNYEERDWQGRVLETSLTYKRIHFGLGMAF